MALLSSQVPRVGELSITGDCEEILSASLPIRVKSGQYIAPKMGTMVITPYRAKTALE